MIPERPSDWIATLGRATAGLALLSVSAYYLLASIPFAYYHFLQFAHFWWLPLFIKTHAAVMAGGTWGFLVTLSDVSAASRRRLALATAPCIGLMALGTVVPALQTYEIAAVLCVAPLVLMTIGSVLDLRAAPQAAVRRPLASRRSLITSSALGALVCAAVYLALGISMLRGRNDHLSTADLLLIVSVAGLGHLLTLEAPLLLWLAASRAADRLGWQLFARSVAAILCAGLVVALLVNRIVLNTLLIPDRWALVVAAAMGLGVSSFWIALLEAHARRSSTAPEPSWLPIQPLQRWRTSIFVLSAVSVVLGVLVLPRVLVLADWGLSLQKTLVVAVWLATLILVRAIPDRWRGRATVATITAVIALAIVTTAVTAAPNGRRSVPRGEMGPALVLQHYGTVDPSVATMLDLLRPAMSDRDFYNRLRTEGDLTDNRSLSAVPLEIAPPSNAALSDRPHIFMIVVDSLRADYLGPYNDAASAFTPHITEFARDALVMRRAFTPYAGTALSQPAIWAGGLIPRFNYVQPFSAVNNLERLVNRGHYRKFVSMDEISMLTLSDQGSIHNLEAGLMHPSSPQEMFKFDLCSSTEEMIKAIDQAGTEQPIFAYTQPQNLHIRVLAEKYPRYEGVRYGDADFFKPAVRALERLDQCFGTFIGALKARRIYDDSIVLLTADHGDAYGEEGRWGHAYYLMPETLRVPLIMHLPARFLQARDWNPDALMMTTDITPTLYDLLGAGYAPSTPLAGRPHTVASHTAAAADDGPLLVQSSYSRAFGLLDREGGWLYVVNANQLTESYFELGDNHATEVPIDPGLSVWLRATLHERLQALNTYYVRH